MEETIKFDLTEREAHTLRELTAWIDLQEIVRRKKLRPGETGMSAEEEEAFILQEIKAARLEERRQI